MTIAAETMRNQYVGTGSSATYPYSFRIFDKSDLVVKQATAGGVLSTLVLDSDYTVTGVGEDVGGNVVLSANLANQFTLYIRRKLPITQLKDFINQGKFFAEDVESAIDRLIAITLQLQDDLVRSYRLPDTEDTSELLTRVPALATRAGKYFGWDNFGRPAALTGSGGGAGVSTLYFNVKDYGAVGDGSTDDSAAFQAALDAITQASIASTLYVPKGMYKIVSTLLLPHQPRPNVTATQGYGLRIVGDGMYSSGLIYSGTDYCIRSNKAHTEAVLFQDFFINHKLGGGIYLPQGAHQHFHRFFSSACALGKSGIYIDGTMANGVAGTGFGAYMTMLDGCRFWGDSGYNGTGVTLKNVLLNAVIRGCFFSQKKQDTPLLVIQQGKSFLIDSCAFETATENLGSQPLVKLDACHDVHIRGCHTEQYYDSFVGIFGGASNVMIDHCRLDHYGITPSSTDRGLVVNVDAASTTSRNIRIGRFNSYESGDHPDVTHGQIYIDPIGCVSCDGWYDITPFSGAQQYTERRWPKWMSIDGLNLLRNPNLRMETATSQPIGLEVPGGLVTADQTFTFARLNAYAGGCRIAQANANVNAKQLRLTCAPQDIHDWYTFYAIVRNKGGAQVQWWLDPLQDAVDTVPLIIPRADELVTVSVRLPKLNAGRIMLNTYQAWDIEVHGLYLVPGDSSCPMSHDALYGSSIEIGRRIFYGLVKPADTAVFYQKGDICLHFDPAAGEPAGWICVTDSVVGTDAGDWRPFGEAVNEGTRAAYDPPNIGAGAGLDVDITVVGAAIGDFAAVAPPYSLVGLRMTAAWVPVANTVRFTLTNPSGAGIDLGAGDWKARTWR